MAGMLNIGLSALNVAQSQLSTTSHNIANAGTDGFTRQRVIQTTLDPLFTGTGFFGQGTKVAGVTRAYSQFLENQVQFADNRRAEYAAYNAQISQLNNLFADPSVGLSATLDSFFAGVQAVAANPTSVATRQALISTGESLVARFQSLDQRVDEVRQGVEGQIGVTIDQINLYARSIADMNQRIVLAQSAGAAAPVNDLLDQRNQLVTELNRLVKVNVVPDSQGALSVFIGTGQTLVIGQTPSTLKVVPSTNDPQRSAVALVGSSGAETELSEKLLTGGELGGMFAFRRESLDPTQNQLGLIAVSLASAFNEQHKLGVDLDGILGQDFFKLPAIRVQPTDAASLSYDAAAIGQLTAADYRLSFDGADYTLTNLSSGNAATVAVGDSFEGLRIDALSLAAGGNALIRPTRHAAGDIAMAISDTRKVAAGNPVAASLAAANTGSLNVSAVVVSSVAGMDVLPASPDGRPDFASIGLSWSANTLAVPAGFTLTSGNPPAADNTYNPVTDGAGKTFEIAAPGGFSFRFTLTGAPADGDSFAFAPNAGGVADNRNANLLGALQTTKLLFEAGGAGGTVLPTATLGEAYAQMVSRVGNKTREVQINEQAQDALLAQASDAREALSGVNLDEEAANLVRYQQSYQAAGQVMSVAQRLFDELIAIGR